MTASRVFANTEQQVKQLLSMYFFFFLPLFKILMTPNPINQAVGGMPLGRLRRSAQRPRELKEEVIRDGNHKVNSNGNSRLDNRGKNKDSRGNEMKNKVNRGNEVVNKVNWDNEVVNKVNRGNEVINKVNRDNEVVNRVNEVVNKAKALSSSESAVGSSCKYGTVIKVAPHPQ